MNNKLHIGHVHTVELSAGFSLEFAELNADLHTRDFTFDQQDSHHIKLSLSHHIKLSIPIIAS